MDNVPDKIIDKIRKLLALSDSPNEAEAAVALGKAHDLLKQHNLDMKDIQNKTAELDPVGVRVAVVIPRTEEWMRILYIAVGRLNYCSMLQHTRPYGEICLVYVGKSANILASNLFNEYITEAIKKATKKLQFTKAEERRSFSWGFIAALVPRLEAMHGAEMNSDCRDLVVSEKLNNENFIKQRFTNLVDAKTKAPKTVSEGAYLRGLAAGNTIPLNTQIEGASA